MCFVSPQSLQSERAGGRPEAELWRTRFHRSHHQHPHAARQHAWWEPPPIARPHPRHPAQHPGHRLHPGHRQNLLLITSDHAHDFPHVTQPTAPPANLPMNSDLPLNLWSWTRGTASWDCEDNDYLNTLSSAGCFHFFSPLCGLRGMNQNENRMVGSPYGRKQPTGAEKSSKNQRQGIWKGTIIDLPKS